MTIAEIRQEALIRATSGNSLGNFPAIFDGFEAKGIPADQIKPRENVLTYAAWQAVKRQVRKGEKGVKVSSFRSYSKTVKNDDGSEKTVSGSKPSRATVFHISQTEKIGE